MNKLNTKIFFILIFFFSPFLISNSIYADTLIVPVISSLDDAEEMGVNGNMLMVNSSLRLVNDKHKYQTVGIRFTNITIPPGAVILNAYIEFTAERRGTGNAQYNFYTEASPNAAPITKDRYNLTNRTLSTNSVSWTSIPNWLAAGDVHQSADLAVIIQELIDQPGWASGNAVLFILTGFGERRALSYDGSAVDAPRLFIEFTPVPDLVVLKSVQTLSDPFNGSSNPKAIPGAEMLYTINVTNFGTGPADLNSVYTTDPIPLSSALFVGDLNSGSGPISFSDGADASGLTYTYGGLNDNNDDLEFSNDGGLSFNYTPSPDTFGYDANVTHLRINPKGQLSPSLNGATPSYTINFKTRIQ